jgi:hypothetical protein
MRGHANRLGLSTVRAVANNNTLLTRPRLRKIALPQEHLNNILR